MGIKNDIRAARREVKRLAAELAAAIAEGDWYAAQYRADDLYAVTYEVSILAQSLAAKGE